MENVVADAEIGVGLGLVRAARRASARAEFGVWSAVLSHAATILDLAQALRVSEYAVEQIERDGRERRRRLPAVWAAFRDGELDGRRVEAIVGILEGDSSQELLTFLDDRAPEYGTDHTVADLRRWLRRWQARLDPRTAEERAEGERSRRHLRFHHGAHGMCWVEAYLPSPAAAAIERRLTDAARRLPTVLDSGPDAGCPDTRTLEQKQADLAVAWLTTVEGSGSAVQASVGVVIEASDLFGWTDGPAAVAGLGTPIPAGWVRELLSLETTALSRLLTDERGEVLDVTRISYRPSARLREALQWRDGQCRVAGCTAPAHSADLDHVVPFEQGGPTHADNLHHLCRRHHRIKSHGRLWARHHRRSRGWIERLEMPGRDGPIEVDLWQPKHPARC